ncbi:MAG TPA: hypothetical protein VFN61_00100 [Acidimicrobiales bacterium]|nr:hypothetical protein [Acidimicrobiales bacterium]
MKVPASPPKLTLLAFLTTTCKTCAGLWSDLKSAPPGGPIGAELVVVTPSKSMEDEEEAKRLLPGGARLHMSSGTWFFYGVLQAGTFLLALPGPEGLEPWLAPGEVLGMASVTDLSELPPLLLQWTRRSPGMTSSSP